MNDLSQILKAGTLLVIETGEYSDRCWTGPVRMLRDATKRDMAEAYRAQWTKPVDDEWAEGPDNYGFLPWLIKEGWVEHVDDVTSWHVGSYGSFEPY